ncbi:MAG TPA: glycerophosphodiester phosphodiesterase family protein [Steroidobacteraceae bacterium]
MDILGLIGRTCADFGRRWRLVFAWQLLVQLLGIAAVAPLAGWLAKRFVARSGSAVVSNYDIATFVLSPAGVAFVLLALVTTVTFYMAQFAGYSWIAGHAIERRPVTLRSTLGAVYARLRLLLRLGLRILGRILLLALPFLAIVLFVWLTTLRGHDINYFLAEKPPEWHRALLAAGIAGAGYAFVALVQFARWIFTMPIAMFHGSLHPAAVLQASERMLEGRLLRTIAPLLAWWASLATAFIALCWAGRQLTEIAMRWAGIDVHRVLPLVTVFLAVTLACSFVYATLQFAGHQFLVTRLYAERREAPLWLGDRSAALAEGAGRRCGGPIVGGLIAITALALGIGGLMLSRLKLHEDVLVTAHRGASLHAPENSLAAFREAIAAGADCIELDVQRTRDGAIVVVHDGDLMRMAGDPRKVADLALQDLQAIDIGRKRGPQHAGEHVPTLGQVIALVRGKVLLNVELKYNVPDPGLAAAVVDLLQRENFADQAVITSLDHAGLRQVEAIAPDIRTGLIVTASVGNVVRTDTDFVSLNSAKATADLVRRAHAAGKAVHVWTVNKPEVMLRMIERDVDSVITDDPALLVRVMRERNALSNGEKLGLGLRVLFTQAPPELEDATAVPAL